MAYNGRRMGWSRRYSSRSGGGAVSQTLARVLLFPVMLIYLELVLHIVMRTDLIFAPVYLMFAVAGGLFLSALTLPWRKAVNSFVARILSVLVSLVYVAEMIAKTILQTYYGLSALKLAAGNRLTDYSNVVLSAILSRLPVILVFLLPAILLCFFGGRIFGFKRLDIRFAGIVLAGAAVFHIAGLGVVHLPWKGDLTPAELYRMDTNLDDQVERLGLWTMLRLDVKHMLVPVKNTMGDDFSGLEMLKPDGAAGSVSEPDSSSSRNALFNMMDIDLAALAENGATDDIKWLANYFNNVTPTRKNEYTGMFEGYNVIQIVIEGFSGYAIDPELTPTLYKLANEGFVFQNYYTALHYTSTSNGECQTLLGLYPKNGEPATMTRAGEIRFPDAAGENTKTFNPYFSLARQLGREGYQCLGYHGNYEMYGRLASHTNLGYDWKQYESGFDNLELNDSGELLWPQRDSYVVEASVDEYINSNQPFHIYYLTISGHMPYLNNRVVWPYEDTVRALPYSETTQDYIATVMEADRALKTLLDKLEAAGKLDKTLIVATADHIPYFNVDTLEEITGKQFGSSKDLEYLKEGSIDFDVYKNTLILWSASMDQPVVVEKPCCQVDILPTVSNLLGLEYDSRMLAGSDILSDSEGLVVFSSRCWITDRGFYNRYTGEFTPAQGVTMTEEEREEYVSTMRRLVGYKLDSTALIVENNFYDCVFGQ